MRCVQVASGAVHEPASNSMRVFVKGPDTLHSMDVDPADLALRLHAVMHKRSSGAQTACLPFQ